MQLRLITACLIIAVAATLPPHDGRDLTLETNEQIRSVTVPLNTTSDFTATLNLDFDEPVNAVETRQHVDALTNTGAPLARRVGPAYISCEGSGNWADTDGTFFLQYTCTPSYPLAWGFTISPAVQAIIVSWVNEKGLSWWKDGVRMADNSPHPETPKDYTLHGNMRGATPNSKIQYQDYMTFRHNVGPGGTGSIVFSGEVTTLED